MAVQFSPESVVAISAPPSWADRAGVVLTATVTSALVAITDALDDVSYWFDRAIEKHAVEALDDLAPCRLLYATYGDADVSALMQYYLTHDKYLSVGSAHRFMSRRGMRSQFTLVMVFVRDAVLYEAHVLDAYELLTGEPVDRMELGELPGRALERPNALAGSP